MARTFESTAARRVAMQALMWLILGATLAVAAVISHRDGGASRVVLGVPTRVGALTVALPQGWKVSVREGTLTASEPAPAPLRRMIEIQQEALDQDPLPSAEELLESRAQTDLRLTELKFAGLHVTGAYMENFIKEDDDAPQHSVLIGAAVLPSRIGIFMVLKGTPDRSDLGLFQKIADTIKLAGPLDRTPKGEGVARIIAFSTKLS